MGRQEPAAPVADGQLGDVLVHHVGELGCAEADQEATAPLDLAGEGEAVPQAPAEPVVEHQLHLLVARVAAGHQQRAVGPQPLEAARLECRRPGANRRPAQGRPGREVAAVGGEAAVERAPTLALGARVGMLAVELLFAVDELHGASVPRKPS